MGNISVAQVAKRLGVGVARVHQRIADGSLPAERIGSQWAIDEASLVPLFEAKYPGRPLSERSAWALLAFSVADGDRIEALAPSERSRAKDRLVLLLSEGVSDAAFSEVGVNAMAYLLRSMLRNRAERRLYRAAPRDLPDLRDNARVALSGLSHPDSGIAAGDLVEGYVASADLDAVVDDYLLSSVASVKQANVVLHVASAAALSSLEDIPPLLLATDLAEHRGPREEARAAELVRALAAQHSDLVAEAQQHRRSRRKTRG
jgi:excisionase family DNA binding protein